jgi:hypothetical protein
MTTMKNIDKMSALLSMIQLRSTDMCITHDVLNDYTEEQLELVFEVMDTIIDFHRRGFTTCRGVGCNRECKNEKCTIEVYSKILKVE